jgi:hypothetical protein
MYTADINDRTNIEIPISSSILGALLLLSISDSAPNQNAAMMRMRKMTP